MELREFIDAVENSSLKMKDYKKYFIINQSLYTNEIISAIEEISMDKKEIILEYLLNIAEQDGLNKSYTHIFCKLLEQDWHDWHEDIIMHLEIIKDPDSVDCIYNASFKTKEYDDGKSLAKKCIWALGAINTSKSYEKIELLTHSSNPIIKEVSLMQLNHNKAK